MQNQILVDSRIHNAHSTPIFFVLLIIISSLWLRHPVAAQSSLETCCHEALPLALNTPSESWGGTAELHRLSLPSAGLLFLELIEDSSWTSFSDTDFELIEMVLGNATVIEQSATYLVLAAEEPAELILQTYSASPFFLHTRFETARVVEDIYLSQEDSAPLVRTRLYSISSTSLNEPVEVDPDPDLTSSPRGHLLADLIYALPQQAGTEPAEVDPDPDTPLSAIPAKSLESLYSAAKAQRPQVLSFEPNCGTPAPSPTEDRSEDNGDDSGDDSGDNNGDDYSDSLTCPTPIASNSTITGTLGSSHRGIDPGPDHDVFSITISRATTMEIFTTGPTETLLSLHDRAGKPLAKSRAHDGSSGNHSRILRTLAPGRYSIRVTGTDGAEGPYRLEVASLQPPS